jgi:small neutral amino acid transporter SnatA (MarC family)
MAASGAMLPAAARRRRWLGNSTVAAIEKLMGLVLAVAVEMILAGLKHYLFGTD